LNFYTEADNLTPGKAHILYGTALCLETLGRKTKKEKQQDESVELFKNLAYGTFNYPKARIKLVEVYYQREKPMEMLKAAKDAVKLLPEDAMAAYQMAEAYRMLEQEKYYPLAVSEYLLAKELAREENVLETYELGIHFGLVDSLIWAGREDTARHFMKFVRNKINLKTFEEKEELAFIFLALGEEKNYKKMVAWTAREGGESKKTLFEEEVKKIYSRWQPLKIKGEEKKHGKPL
jgi:tetratricopeptide (TPR) repeat protein